MGVSTSIGPISGIDYGKLITGLTGIDQQPIDDITTQLAGLDKQSAALTDLATLITGLKVSAASFASSAVFKATTATPTNPSVATAIAGAGTPVGNYAFNVQQLASSSQQVTQGFASSTTALGLTGTIKLQLGGGSLDDAAKLGTLNGGAGVSRGSIRITDRSGASSLVDLSHAVDINDVVNTINSATGVNIVAKVDGDHLVLSDNSGGSGTLAVTNAGGTTTASDLGLTTAASGTTLTGTSVTGLKSTTTLDSLNDGLGVRTAGILNDFTITGSAGAASISLNGATTLSDVISKINAAKLDAGGAAAGISAAISADGHGITLTDSGGGPITVTTLNASLAANDLGIAGTSTGGTLVGGRIASTLSGPLLTNLNGGWQGQAGEVAPKPGTVTINGQTIDLSNAQSLNDVITTLNTNTQGVTASINQAGTGVTLSSNAASFTIADGTGNLASFLKISGTSTATASGSQISSGDLRLRYLSDNTRLSTLNGGAGVKAGSIRVSDGNGASLTVDLSGSDVTTIGAVLKRINNSGLALTARVNDTGDGILLTQTAGSGTASIQDLAGGTTAKDLGILGTFSSGKLDGSFQKTITLAATDTLSDISSKINSANAGVATSIINDGSGTSPFRLSLVSRNSGVAGRLILDGSGAGLSTTSLVTGQDAAIIFGGNANGTGGLLATSSTNTFGGLVPGLTLTLNGVGNTNVAVNSDTSKITTAVQGFVDAYNQVVNNISTVTAFNSTDQTQNGVLFGNNTVQLVQDGLGQFVGQAFASGGSLNTLASIGISIGQDGTLSLDSDKLNTVLATDPQDVQALFTTNTKAIAGGPQSITTSTLLSSVGTGFPGGHISITDGFGTAYDVDLSAATTIGAVISSINTATGGKVTAGINSTGDGILLAQIGGTGTASVAEVSGGTAAAALNIKGTFSGGILNGAFLPVLPKNAVKGVGGTLSDLLDRFTDAQTGILFQSTDSIATQETQLKDRQTDLSTLLTAKKNRLIEQFANLEVTIAQLQQQGTAISNFKPVTPSTTSSK